jgi:hypothetical protein
MNSGAVRRHFANTGDVMRRAQFRLGAVIGCAAIVLGIVSAVGVGAAIGGLRNLPAQPWTSACATPALSGSVADVTLTCNIAGRYGARMNAEFDAVTR